MWRHRCAGGLKKLKLYLRSGSQRHRHFVGFFNVPVLHRHGTNLFIRRFRHAAPLVECNTSRSAKRIGNMIKSHPNISQLQISVTFMSSAIKAAEMSSYVYLAISISQNFVFYWYIKCDGMWHPMKVTFNVKANNSRSNIPRVTIYFVTLTTYFTYKPDQQISQTNIFQSFYWLILCVV